MTKQPSKRPKGNATGANDRFRMLFVNCMESVTKAATVTGGDQAICALFACSLPMLLSESEELLTDRRDLEKAVTVTLPVLICLRIASHLSRPVVQRLYPRHVRQRIAHVAWML